MQMTLNIIKPPFSPRFLQVSNGSRRIGVHGLRIHVAGIVRIVAALVTDRGHARLRVVVVHLGPWTIGDTIVITVVKSEC